MGSANKRSEYRYIRTCAIVCLSVVWSCAGGEGGGVVTGLASIAWSNYLQRHQTLNVKYTVYFLYMLYIPVMLWDYFCLANRTSEYRRYISVIRTYAIVCLSVDVCRWGGGGFNGVGHYIKDQINKKTTNPKIRLLFKI